MKAPISWRAAAVLLAVWVSGAGAAQSKELARPGFDLEQRIACQTILEEIRWSHTIWPESNPAPKPDRAEILSDAAIRAKVETSLRRETALFDLYGVRIDAKALQDELNRMARNTKAPERLREIYAALGNDATSVGECVARPNLVDRRLREAYANDARWNAQSEERQNFDAWWLEQGTHSDKMNASTEPNTLSLPASGYVVQSETLAKNGAVAGVLTDFRYKHTAVWTGSEMIIWGGEVGHGVYTATGYRYDPASDTWATLTTTGAPAGRSLATAVWTGSKMIVWGGSSWDGCCGFPVPGNTGGVYDLATDSWTATSTTNVTGRYFHTAVWTGSEMIVFGGIRQENGVADGVIATGSRYNPISNAWTHTSSSGVARFDHVAAWTGGLMIVWGGMGEDESGRFVALLTGSIYNPVTNAWFAMTTTNAPEARRSHTAVWTDSEMIVWGGLDVDRFPQQWMNTGGRFNLSSLSWTATAIEGAPSQTAFPGSNPVSVWTGSEMIVWVGDNNDGQGGRYNPENNTWTPIATTIAATGDNRSATAVWSGSEMFVYGWAGGSRYNLAADSWVPMAPASIPIIIFVDDFE